MNWLIVELTVSRLLGRSLFYPSLYLFHDLFDDVAMSAMNVAYGYIGQLNGFSIVSDVNNDGGIGQQHLFDFESVV